MRVLMDANVLLDYLLDTPDRQVHRSNAQKLWDAHSKGLFEGFVSAISPINIFYIVYTGRGYKKDIETARAMVQQVISTFSILPIDHQLLQTAWHSPFKDYEDAVQHTNAVIAGLDAIVTRDVKDFSEATISVYTPEQFIKVLFPNNP